MTESIIPEILYSPCTSTIIGINIIFFIIIRVRGWSADKIALSYQTMVINGEWYRAITSSISHINVLHIAFNMTSIWSYRFIEHLNGTLYYIKESLVLLLCSVALLLVMYHVLIKMFNKDIYMNTYCLGYSCVLFGWMTLVAAKTPYGQSISILGYPMSAKLAPFIALLLASLVFPNASFVGHLSGIIIGFIVATIENVYGDNWLSNYLFWNSLLWVFIIFIASLKASYPVLPILEYEDSDFERVPYIIENRIPSDLNTENSAILDV